MIDPRPSPVSAARRRTALDALRRGAVPESGLDLLATGLDRFESALDAELDAVASGASVFKAVRGEYGSGKTFFTRWLGEHAKQRNFAVSEIQVSETETPLHKLETVYRRLTERLSTPSFPPSALRPVVDAWFYALEEDALAAGADEDDLSGAVEELLTARLTEVSRHAPSFAAALRGYRSALADGDEPTAAAVLSWLGGQPHADDAYVAGLARAVGGALGGKVGVAPRLFLKKLVGDVLDRIDQFPDFDPRQHYRLTVGGSELTDIERNLAGSSSADDIGLEL